MPAAMFFPIARNMDPEDAMYWHVTGKSRIVEEEPVPNCMNQIVRWMKNEETPLIHKVGVIALAAIVTLVVGYLVGQTLLVFTTGAIITVLWALRESAVIKASAQQKILNAEKAAREAAKDLRDQQAAFASMQVAFGGEAAWELIPNLDLGNRIGGTGYLDFLEPNELAHPVMKGADRYGRPFVALKLRRLEDDSVEAVTLFQRYTEGGAWTYGTRGMRNYFHDTLADTDLDDIRKILANNHPRFVLAQ